MRGLLLAGLCLALSAPAQQMTEEKEREFFESSKVCEAPPKHMAKDSSNNKFMGIGGPEAHKCAKAELFWISGDHFSAACFKGENGKVMKLGHGHHWSPQAIFSPDCKLFFSTGDEIEVRAAKDGSVVAKFKGNFPSWGGNNTLYFESGSKKEVALQSFDLKAKQARTIASVKDYGDCKLSGEAIAWRPVDVGSDGNLRWTYPGALAPDGKMLTVNPKSGKILRTDATQTQCE